ncbi:hypothetical protein [Sorangium sp. So ce542]|uniref:hypothetical protein n=1 Tax=Sorangium sp. So ce542 TaxID=3133316 RepID=UPI003F60EA48
MFKLTIAVGLGLLGAAGVAPMPGRSTAEPFGIREARADGPLEPDGPGGSFDLGGLDAKGALDGKPVVQDFTWGNGITAEQFRRYGNLLCANTDLKLGVPLRDNLYVASEVFAAHMGEPGFDKWFSYLVRDGAPSGTKVRGDFLKGKNRFSVWFTGAGGLTSDWLTIPLRMNARSVVLGSLSAFVNDNGPKAIVRACSACSGMHGISASQGSVTPGNPKIAEANDKKDWLLELAYVAQCAPSSTQRNSPLTPKVSVFWSEQLGQTLKVLESIGGHIEERMCTRAHDEQDAGPKACPFKVVGSMKDHCKMKQGMGMSCKIEGQDKDATYTFIDPTTAVKKYRLPTRIEGERPRDLPRPQLEVTPAIQNRPAQVKAPKAR